MQIFSDRLRQARKQQGFSQRDLGNIVGCDASNISKLECGWFLPSIPNLIKLSQGLNVSSDWLLGLKSDKEELYNDRT